MFLLLLSGVLVAVRLTVKLGLTGTGGNVLYVEIDGPIDDKRVPEVAEWIYTTLERDRFNRIKGVFVYINSPGGSAASSEEVYQALKAASKSGRKVVAYIHSIGASGGYFVASAADRIVANPAALTGSIGAIIVIPEITKLSEKLGVSWDIYKSGKNKDLTQPFKRRTEEDSVLLTELAKEIWRVFLKRVAEGRGKGEEDLLPIADGRLLTASEALKWGLVDTLGTKHTAVEILKRDLGLKKVRFVKKKKKKRLLQQILEGGGLLGDHVADWMIPRANF